MPFPGQTGSSSEAVSRADRRFWALPEVPLSGALAMALVAGGGAFGTGDLLVHLGIAGLVFPALMWNAQTLSTAVGRRWALWWAAVGAWLLLPLLMTWMPQFPWRIAQFPGQYRALLAWVSACAVFLLAACVRSASTQWRILQAATLLAIASGMAGFWQAANPEPVPLLPWGLEPAPSMATGTFANRNHFASLLGMCLPIALVSAFQAATGHRTGHAVGWLLGAMCLLLAVLLTYSRMGTVLGGLAACVVTAVVLWQRSVIAARHRHVIRLCIVAALVLMAGLMLWGGYAWESWASRLGHDPMTDLRWQYLRNGLPVLKEVWPWGSGMGTFATVYAAHEPVQDMLALYARHAHNDILETVIEAGWVGASLMLGLLLVLGMDGRDAIRSDIRSEQRLQRFAMGVGMVLPLLHSIVDYPLRTYAVLLLWVTLAGFVGGGVRRVTIMRHYAR